MARYGKRFKERAVARLLPPESADLSRLSREIGVSVPTLERWRSEAQSTPARGRVWTAPARLQALILTAPMDEVQRSAWCREQGIFPSDLKAWEEAATAALLDPEEGRATPAQTRQTHKRIKELEREVQRKDRALAETAALLVLSKKAEAIFRDGGEG
jgi:transposase